MRFLKFAVLAALLLMPISSVDAGVLGSAIFSTSDIRVQRSDSMTGMFNNVSAGDVNVTQSNLTVLNTATINGAVDQQIGIFGPGVATADTAQAFISSGADVAPAENTFTRTVPTSTSTAFARADSLTSGSLLTTGGLNTETIAEIESGDGSFGDSISSTGGTSSFFFSVGEEGFYRLQFDAGLDLLTESMGSLVATADSALTIQINGASISLDSPFLNQSISGTDATGPLAFTDVTTGSIFLDANTIHTLTINQVASVSVAVPEPTSAMTFIGLMAVVGFNRRRRSLRASC